MCGKPKQLKTESWVLKRQNGKMTQTSQEAAKVFYAQYKNAFVD